ncbi:MAG: 1-acyl-sn-glycerol-3-phosphate acyltransferase [Alphaproteobacteria bacterium]|nr:1-acyl-sn-glycerol-3-phosphate acyltransferase [Alphaproteobacteria bacterium]
MKNAILWLRSLAFNALFIFWAAVPTFLMVWIVLLPKRQLFFWIRTWQNGLGWIERNVAGIHYQVLGRENLPEGACIIAAKHQSAWETCKLHVLFGDPAIVLKEELTHVPVWGWYARASGMIPVDRGGRTKALTKMMAAARAAKAKGLKIVIFPQGTRVPVGERKPYKSGVAALYKELNLPIVPMAVNSGLFWPKNTFIKKPGLITIELLPPIPAGLPRPDMMRQLEEKLEGASDRLAGKNQPLV